MGKRRVARPEGIGVGAAPHGAGYGGCNALRGLRTGERDVGVSSEPGALRELLAAGRGRRTGVPQSARGLWGAHGRGFAPRLLLTGAAGLRRTGQRNELAPGFGASREEQEQVCSAVKPSLFGGWC